MEGRFNAGFFALPVWGAYINLEGLLHGGAYFQNFMVASISLLFFVGEDHFFFRWACSYWPTGNCVPE